MPRPSSHILELARKGAEHRYQELKSELSVLIKNFPHLAEQAGAAVGHAVGTAENVVRKRSRMSAAARRAVSERMKKYWAARRKSRK